MMDVLCAPVRLKIALIYFLSALCPARLDRDTSGGDRCHGGGCFLAVDLPGAF